MKIEVTSTSVAPVRRMPVPAESTASLTIEKKSEVTLSSEGQVLAAEYKKLHADAEFSAAENQEKFSRIWGVPRLDDQVWVKYRALGAKAFAAMPAPTEYTTKQTEQFEKSKVFLVKVQERGDTSSNPFSGLSRAELAAIVQDEVGYTKEERVVADYEVADLDNNYFRAIAQHASQAKDSRILAKGYLEYLDNLSPVERLRFPPGERDRVAAEAQQPPSQPHAVSLPEGFSLLELLVKLRRMLEEMRDDESGLVVKAPVGNSDEPLLSGSIR